MALITNQQIKTYYDLYKSVDVTFNKDVIINTRLNPKDNFIKCLEDRFPCVIYSTSMIGSKVIADIKPEAYKKIQKVNNIVSLRFSFSQIDKTTPLTFFIGSKVIGFTPYAKNNPNLNFLSLSYTQHPADDLIIILGHLLETTNNYKHRKEERIIIIEDTLRKIGIKPKSSAIIIDNTPVNCIIRDLSFTGAKCIIHSSIKSLLNKEIILKIDFDELNKSTNLKGKVVRFEQVEQQQDLNVLAIHYEENIIPMEYKMKINDYLSSVKRIPKRN